MVIGLFVGAMPGLGSVNGVAILLPFTFVVQGISGDATSPMIFLAAVYYGAISSVALGIPGASTAVATTFDGRPPALGGKRLLWRRWRAARVRTAGNQADPIRFFTALLFSDIP